MLQQCGYQNIVHLHNTYINHLQHFLQSGLCTNNQRCLPFCFAGMHASWTPSTSPTLVRRWCEGSLCLCSACCCKGWSPCCVRLLALHPGRCVVASVAVYATEQRSRSCVVNRPNRPLLMSLFLIVPLDNPAHPAPCTGPADFCHVMIDKPLEFDGSTCMPKVANLWSFVHHLRSLSGL